MRASLLLIVFFIIFGLFLWSTLSGALFFLSLLAFTVFIIISIYYHDIAVLFFLGARGIRASSSQDDFALASKQESYKLSISQPNLYFYNGTLGRAFVLQNGKTISLVIDKLLLEKLNKDDFSALCFLLLLQTKKGMAKKRSRILFILGFISWLVHSFTGLAVRLIPGKEIKQSFFWLTNYLLQPLLSFLFQVLLGDSYFKKLEQLLSEFTSEFALIKNLGLKLELPTYLKSLPSRKLLELLSIQKSQSYQTILSLECLPHEFDILFTEKGQIRD